ncbi:hypothetical protein [Winogradskyella litoriviva]|nr:hypothetical protein [Winogradskyella litoriviva]
MSNFLTNRFDLLVRFASRQNEHKIKQHPNSDTVGTNDFQK